MPPMPLGPPPVAIPGKPPIPPIGGNPPIPPIPGKPPMPGKPAMGFGYALAVELVEAGYEVAGCVVVAAPPSAVAALDFTK